MLLYWKPKGIGDLSDFGHGKLTSYFCLNWGTGTLITILSDVEYLEFNTFLYVRPKTLE